MSKVSFENNTNQLSKEINKQLEQTMLDILLDLKRTASESTPHKSGKLEKSFSYSMKNNGNTLQGEVSVSAMNGSVDYAKIMHDSDYKLGKQSQKKPGGKSAYGGSRVKVGKNYLSNPVAYAEDGYIKAMERAMQESVAKFND